VSTSTAKSLTSSLNPLRFAARSFHCPSYANSESDCQDHASTPFFVSRKQAYTFASDKTQEQENVRVVNMRICPFELITDATDQSASEERSGQFTGIGRFCGLRPATRLGRAIDRQRQGSRAGMGVVPVVRRAGLLAGHARDRPAARLEAENVGAPTLPPQKLVPGSDHQNQRCSGHSARVIP